MVTPDIKIDPVTQFQRKPGDTTKCLSGQVNECAVRMSHPLSTAYQHGLTCSS